MFFFFQAEDGIRDDLVTGVQTCALPICKADRNVLPDSLAVTEIDRFKQANLHFEHIERTARQPARGGTIEVGNGRDDLAR